MEQIETAGGSEAIFDLINIVRQDPSIWDRTSATYITHFDVKIHRFAEIAEQLNLEAVSAEVVASAWRELSEKYRRRLYDGKRRNGATNWPYFEAMSFLRDQYEQTKWYRPMARPNQMPSPSNVAHLVDTFLTAQAVLDAEQTISKAVEPMLPVTISDSLQQKEDTVLTCQIGNGDERKSEFTAKYELVDPAFQSFTSAEQNELAANVDVDSIAIASAAADSTKSPERYEEKQSVSPSASVDGIPQSSNSNVVERTTPVPKTRLRAHRYEAYRSPRRMWKQQKQSGLHASRLQTSSSINPCGIPSGETVAEILRSVRVGTSEGSLSQPSAGLNASQQLSCSPSDSSSLRWENVGRVWVDMMKTIRSPQLALAAHKYIMNTLFSVLEADQQLIGTDPSTTRVRIRESAPQIEITMHQ